MIGNSVYEEVQPLPAVQPDAARIARVLETKLDFDVVQLSNLTLHEMKDAIADFQLELQKRGAHGFFYYAGHGLQLEETNYLVPTDTSFSQDETSETAKQKLLPLMDVVYAMDRRRFVNIVVMDACRENPFAKLDDGKTRTFIGSRGLAPMKTSPDGFLVAYSTKHGEVANDDGVYAKVLEKWLSVRRLDIVDVFRLVRDDLVRRTRQRPFIYHDIGFENRYCTASCPPRPDLLEFAEPPDPDLTTRPEEATGRRNIANGQAEDGCENIDKFTPFDKALNRCTANLVGWDEYVEKRRIIKLLSDSEVDTIRIDATKEKESMSRGSCLKKLRGKRRFAQVSSLSASAVGLGLAGAGFVLNQSAAVDLENGDLTTIEYQRYRNNVVFPVQGAGYGLAAAGTVGALLSFAVQPQFCSL